MNMKVTKTGIVDSMFALVLFAGGLHAGPLDTWTWRYPLPPLLDYYGATYGNGQFVVVGDCILTSSNGVNWLPHQATVDTLSACAYGGGLFAAVGFEGQIVTSSDGVNWVPRSSTSGFLDAIVYGDGQFVAGGDSILTSSDGVNWVHQSSTATNLYDITYGNGQFVAVDDAAGAIVTSPDGRTWINHSVGLTNFIDGIAYGNGEFVAVGWDSQMRLGSIVTSPDGLTWTTRTSGTTDELIGVTYGNNQFAAVGGVGTILTSPDGVTWIERLSGTGEDLLGVTYGSNQFAAVGREGTVVTSPDGVTWTNHQSATTLLDFESIAYGNGRFLAVGDTNVLTSTDGVTWSQSNTQNPLYTVAYLNGQFLASGGTDEFPSPGFPPPPPTIVSTSADGVKWVDHPVGWHFSSIAYRSGQLVGMGQDSQTGIGSIVTSADGTNWVLRVTVQDLDGSNSDPGLEFSSVAYGNGQFVAVGGNSLPQNRPTNGLNGVDYAIGAIATSADGVTWVQRECDTTNALLDIAYGNGQFVAVGGHVQDFWASGFLDVGSIVTSADGTNWLVRVAGISPGLRKVAYGNGQFVAMGENGIMLSSADGVNWTQPQQLTDWSLGPDGIAYGNGHFVVLSRTGILESGSIITLAAIRDAQTGLPRLSLEGPTGLNYAIQSSPDLITWQTVTNITSTQPTSVFLDSVPAASGRMFYRACSR